MKMNTKQINEKCFINAAAYLDSIDVYLDLMESKFQRSKEKPMECQEEK